MESDEQLVSRAVEQRDRRAFEHLVLRHQSAVRRWTRRLCNGDIHRADDLAQETFIKAYTALAAFRGQARFSTWLYRIAFHLAVSRWRSERRKEWDSGVEVTTTPEKNESDQLDARWDLESAMRTLSEPRQLAIRLSLEEGFSHEEIAEIMNLPLGTVKTHIVRGKKQLRVLLAPWQEITA